MVITFTARIEDRQLRPIDPVQLPEGAEVQVTVTSAGHASPADAAAILAEIAALPVEGGGSSHTARDHDAVLYGKGSQK